MDAHLKDRIREWLDTHKREWQRVNACIEAFRNDIFDDAGNYLPDGKEIVDFIKFENTVAARFRFEDTDAYRAWTETVAVLTDPAKGLYVHYGFDEDKREGTIIRGPFTDLMDALRDIQEHKPLERLVSVGGTDSLSSENTKDSINDEQEYDDTMLSWNTTVKIYEDNGGGIHAIVEQGGVLNKVIPHLEREPGVTGEIIIAEAKKGFPYADAYYPDGLSGQDVRDAVAQMKAMDALIVEVSSNEIFYHYEKMGVEGKGLFAQKYLSHPSMFNKKDHPRLFVDMDGTLARFHDEVQYLERMYEPDFFTNLKPFLGAVETVREVMRVHPDWEVYVLSAAIPGDPPGCERQKNAWLEIHLPEIDQAHRLFPPIGADKSEVIPGGIQKTDVLLDDYNKNLEDWRTAGGVAVKFVNNINDRALKGPRWDGWRLHHDTSAAFNVEQLDRCVTNDAPNAAQSATVRKPPRGPHL